MARYCLRLDVLEYLLTLWAEAGLNVAALAELARVQWPIALRAVQMLVYWKRWLLPDVRMLAISV
jgi:hypothetical protein